MERSHLVFEASDRLKVVEASFLSVLDKMLQKSYEGSKPVMPGNSYVDHLIIRTNDSLKVADAPRMHVFDKFQKIKAVECEPDISDNSIEDEAIDMTVRDNTTLEMECPLSVETLQDTFRERSSPERVVSVKEERLSPEPIDLSLRERREDMLEPTREERQYSESLNLSLPNRCSSFQHEHLLGRCSSFQQMLEKAMRKKQNIAIELQTREKSNFVSEPQVENTRNVMSESLMGEKLNDNSESLDMSYQESCVAINNMLSVTMDIKQEKEETDDLFCVAGLTESQESEEKLRLEEEKLRLEELWKEKAKELLSLPQEFLDLDNCDESKLFKCQMCSKQFLTKSRLSKHALTHSKQCFRCSFCDFNTKRKDYLRVHEMNHMETKMFKCMKCDFGTNVRSRLKVHESIHAEEKSFKCFQCSYKTTRKDNLKLHELNHLNIKRFMCDHCGYGSNNKRNLREHMLNHSEWKMFKCSECSYETNKKGNLKLHQVTHVRRVKALSDTIHFRLKRPAALPGMLAPGENEIFSSHFKQEVSFSRSSAPEALSPLAEDKNCEGSSVRLDLASKPGHSPQWIDIRH